MRGLFGKSQYANPSPGSVALTRDLATLSRKGRGNWRGTSRSDLLLLKIKPNKQTNKQTKNPLAGHGGPHCGTFGAAPAEKIVLEKRRSL